MPSPIVHAGFALVIGAALLGDYYDRRALAVVLVVLVLPELDTFAGWLFDGAHRALLHNLLVPAAGGALLYYDVRVRERSWLRGRFGDRGVRVAAVALFGHVFAQVLLDYTHLEGVNLFYPLVDTFYRLDGELYLSTVDGFVQTFVELPDPAAAGRAVDVGETGTTQDVQVDNPVNPEGDPDEPDRPPDRRFPVAVFGWQLYLIAAGLFTVVARRLQGPEPADE